MNESTGAKIFLAVIVVAVAGAAVFMLNRFISPREQVFKRPMEYVQEQEPVVTTAFFAGDIMLSRNVAGRMISHDDYAYPFRNVADKVKAADIAFANLESPFSERGPYFKEGSLVFNADPKSIAGLESAGLDVLSTANNHTLDQGKAGMSYTLSWLANNGITGVGTGEGCHRGAIEEGNGIKLGYLAYSYTAYNDGGKVPDASVCDWNDTKAVAADIQALKPLVDFVIVSTHMGTEYKREPDQANETKARAAVDAGADMIIGHHPHWHQVIEQYDGKFIFYSLGNFVFDQMWSQETREGLAVEVLFKDKKASTINLLPVMIDDFCCPRWADGTETKTILQRINPNAASGTVLKDGIVASDWAAALTRP